MSVYDGATPRYLKFLPVRLPAVAARILFARWIGRLPAGSRIVPVATCQALQHCSTSALINEVTFSNFISYPRVGKNTETEYTV